MSCLIKSETVTATHNQHHQPASSTFTHVTTPLTTTIRRAWIIIQIVEMLSEIINIIIIKLLIQRERGASYMEAAEEEEVADIFICAYAS